MPSWIIFAERNAPEQHHYREAETQNLAEAFFIVA